MNLPETIEAIAEELDRARSVLFITGAGVSADSGLPTYRGIGGLYDRELTEEGIPIESALSGHMLTSDPAVAWKYIREIGIAVQGAKPNRAHRVMAAAEERFERAFVLTQNVDGLHRAAGSKNLIEIHGTVDELLCTRCAWQTRVEDHREVEVPPGCPDCGALLRPNVVLFGEMLPNKELAILEEEVSRGFDIVFSVGTSSLFPYIQMPVMLAARSGIPTVEINPEATPVTGIVEYRMEMGAEEAMEAIWEALGEENSGH